jgi:hypothetical protein
MAKLLIRSFDPAVRVASLLASVALFLNTLAKNKELK